MATIVCENCGLRPAAVEVHRQLDGREAVIRLCHHCASAIASRYADAPLGGLEGMVEGIMGPRLRGRAGLLGQLSEMAQQVLRRAAQEALAWGQPRVSVELVLLALLQEVPELRDRLRAAGLDVDGYAAQLERVVARGPARQGERIGLSSALKRVLQIARVQAARLGHDFIGPEHLLLAILTDGESFAAQFLKGAPPDALRERLGGAPAADGAPGAAPPADLPPHLARFSRDLTALARNGDLDPVIGREGEVERVIRILSRCGSRTARSRSSRCAARDGARPAPGRRSPSAPRPRRTRPPADRRRRRSGSGRVAGLSTPVAVLATRP